MGYSKTRADAMIKDHEAAAKREREEADYYASGSNQTGNAGAGAKEIVDEHRAKAREHERKAENLRALKKHWGD